MKGELMMIKKLSLFLLTLGLVAGCSKDAESSEEKVVQPFQAITQLSAFEITTKDNDYYRVESNGDEWVSDDIDQLDQMAISNFLEKVVSLKATIVDEADIVVKEKTLLQLDLYPSEDEKVEMSLYHDAEGNYYGKMSGTTDWLLFSKLPMELEEFSKVYLQDAIDLKVGMLETIQFEDPSQSFELNQTSDFSKVEAAPFISGWFLHDVYDTPFSIEYQTMDAILERLENFRGEATEEAIPSEAETFFTLRLNGSDGQETLVFGEPDEDSVLVHLEEANESYRIPLLFAGTFQLTPFDITDNFISIIPLDSLRQVKLKTTDKTLLIEAEHEVTTNDEDEVSISSDFFLNGDQLDEAAFRKNYQYLAALKYLNPYDGSEPIKDEASLTITYQFQSEGEVLLHTIDFYDLNEEEYLVEKNGIREFTAKKEQLYEMLEVFE